MFAATSSPTSYITARISTKKTTRETKTFTFKTTRARAQQRSFSVQTKKPKNAPKDPFKALEDIKLISVKTSELIKIHDAFDSKKDYNVLILMRSFG